MDPIKHAFQASVEIDSQQRSIACSTAHPSVRSTEGFAYGRTTDDRSINDGVIPCGFRRRFLSGEAWQAQRDGFDSGSFLTSHGLGITWLNWLAVLLEDLGRLWLLMFMCLRLLLFVGLPTTKNTIRYDYSKDLSLKVCEYKYRYVALVTHTGFRKGKGYTVAY